MTLNPQGKEFWCFLQFVASAQILRVNCDEMDRDRSRQLANRNCWTVARLKSFAQITCHHSVNSHRIGMGILLDTDLSTCLKSLPRSDVIGI